MPEIQIPSEVTALIETAPTYLAHAKREIVSGDDYLAANTELAAIKNTEKQLKEKFDYLLEPSKTAFAETKKRLDETFKPGFDKLAEAKKVWDAAITGYRQEQKRLADEETARRQAEVQKEQQRLREAAAAEQAKADKRAADLRAKAEADEAAGRAAAAARAREQADQRQAQAASKVANFEHVAATMTAAPVEVAAPKSDAGHGRKSYSGRLADPSEWTEAERAFNCQTSFEGLILAVAAGITNGTGYPSIALLKQDESALNKQATALKGHFRIPFCRVVEKETTVSARGK